MFNDDTAWHDDQDDRHNPAALAMIEVDRYVYQPGERWRMKRELAAARRDEQRQQTDDLTDWLWPGHRLPATQRQPRWFGDADHDPRSWAVLDSDSAPLLDDDDMLTSRDTDHPSIRTHR